MLSITIPPKSEYWDPVKEEFIDDGGATLQLEHSLDSLSKWESKWHKPFLYTNEKTDEEVLDYIRCMTITPDVDPEVYDRLSASNIREIEDYIANPMTATSINEDKNGKKNREIVTAEVVYYWMIALNIPIECQYWHFNRLITLITVCSIKSTPQKKRSKRDILSKQAALNAARRKQFNTKG